MFPDQFQVKYECNMYIFYHTGKQYQNIRVTWNSEIKRIYSSFPNKKKKVLDNLRFYYNIFDYFLILVFLAIKPVNCF